MFLLFVIPQPVIGEQRKDFAGLAVIGKQVSTAETQNFKGPVGGWWFGKLNVAGLVSDGLLDSYGLSLIGEERNQAQQRSRKQFPLHIFLLY